MSHPPESFDQMEASLLYCPTCRRATPVRKRLLIVLAEGEKFDYVCTQCGTISGDKIERPAPQPLPRQRPRVPMTALPPPPRRRS
jgi:hypothetical protein